MKCQKPSQPLVRNNFRKMNFSSGVYLAQQTIIFCAHSLLKFEPWLTGGAVLLLAAHDALAQTTTGGIFGSDQQVGNAIREAIKWGRNLLFLMGVVFVGWGVVNYGTEKPSVKQFVAALGCFAFGGIVALVYSISQGNAVNLDTGFGN